MEKPMRAVQLIYENGDGRVVQDIHDLNDRMTTTIDLGIDFDPIRKSKVAEGFVFLTAKDFDTSEPFKVLIHPEDIESVDAFFSGECEINPIGGVFELHVDRKNLPVEFEKFIKD